MSNPIPDFDHNLVIPPHLGDPTKMGQLSPYPCTTVDLCQKLGKSAERRLILSGFLDFRARICATGLTNGFQWLDGSFLEDIESSERRAPRDLDVVTVYWGYDVQFQSTLQGQLPEFFSSKRSKELYKVDHYPFDAGYKTDITVELTRYWAQLFSHNRLGVWKGMLKVQLNTPDEDALARKELERVSS
jgi:hypothetical protein